MGGAREEVEGLDDGYLIVVGEGGNVAGLGDGVAGKVDDGRRLDLR